MDKMNLHITFDNQIMEYMLPAMNNRKGILNLSAETGRMDMLLSYEVWDGEWHLKSSDYVRLSQNHLTVDDRVLADGEVFKGKIYKTQERFVLMAQVLNQENAVYEKYYIKNKDTLFVGSNENCDIVYREKFISGIHVKLSRESGTWYITDQSSNGTYVNYQKLQSPQKLQVFDTIYMVGIKMIFLGSVIAVNRLCHASVKIERADLAYFQDNRVYEDDSMFSRTPRLLEPFDEEEVEVEMPPAPVRRTKTPLIFVLGPSLTMPVPILTTVIFNMLVNGGRGASYLGMAISVMMFAALGAMWTMLRNRYDKRQEAENESERVEAYNAYIGQHTQLLEEKQSHNRQILECKYKPSKELAATLSRERYSLWDRNVNHEDFLFIRLGTGSMKSPNAIHVPKARFSTKQDPLVLLPHALKTKYESLSFVPSLLDIRSNKIIGVIGDTQALQTVVNSMLIQVAALHAYTDVKIAIFTRTIGEELNLLWTRWLPHLVSDDRKLRYLGKDDNSCQNVLYALTNELRNRKEQIKESAEGRKSWKHYVIFCTEKEIFENETIYQYMTDEADYGFTFLLLYGELDAFPNECKTIVENSRACQGAYDLTKAITPHEMLRFDYMNVTDAEGFARKLSGITIHELSEGSIPDSMDYFEMLNISRMEQWDLLKHYKENRSFEGLKSLIGVSAGNKPMYLDIHEKKHGPHGLVAGTTGSGKSEAIQTFILSLALNYHPDEVAFILIDYKGGGMANAFLGLPHLAGVITNLGEGEEEVESIDDSQTRRALISIRSEIKRRQTIFNKYKVNHIDLYMRLYRDGKAREPMPHLIMISDEFAELKKEQPDFIKELVSTARVGRSLGIHLILATQKPGGVVDDEIWSNARFKLCLKVQDKQDSMGMLKRPEAAFLTQAGRAYLQIGNDEIFELFQSGYSGAPYDENSVSGAQQEAEVVMIEADASESVVKSKDRKADKNAKTQLKTCMEYIIKIASQSGIRATIPLWKPPLAALIPLTRIEAEYVVDYRSGKVAVAGLVDDPKKQDQYPLLLNLERMNNLLVVGNAGSGKSTLLLTIVYSLIRHYTPEEFQFYCIDFSSRSFRIVESLPHCGGVVFSEEGERVTRLFSLMRSIMKERKAVLEKSGVGSYPEYVRVEKDMPVVVLFIDNYYEFVQLYPEMEEAFRKTARDGSKYGIQLIVTLSHMGDMSYKGKQDFSWVLPLRLNEKGDYAEALGRSPEILPGSKAGRGLAALGEVLEYQAAVPEEGTTEGERQKRLGAYISSVSCQGVRAQHIPVLPRDETYGQLYEKTMTLPDMKSRIPVGYYVEDLQVASVDLEKSFCVSISSVSEKGIANYLNHLLYYCDRQNMECHLVHMGKGGHILHASAADGVYRDYEELYGLMLRLKKEFTVRSSAWKEYAAQQTDAVMADYMSEHFDRLVILIDDMGAFLDVVYHTAGKESMSDLLELFFRNGHGRGIYFFAGYPVDMDTGAFYQNASKIFTGYKAGIHFGGMLNKQKLFEYSLPMSTQMKGLPENIGFCMEEGRAMEIFMPDKAEV